MLCVYSMMHVYRSHTTHNHEETNWHLAGFSFSSSLTFKYMYSLFWNVAYMSRLLTKPTKWPLCPAKTQISLGICPVWSESSLSATIERTAKTLIRLGGCPGWSESSLGAQTILLVLSWGGSYSDHLSYSVTNQQNHMCAQRRLSPHSLIRVIAVCSMGI